MASHAHDDHELTTTGPKVLATSTVSPKVRTIAVVRPAAHDVTYLAATKTGLGITLKHFAKNLFGRRRTVEAAQQGRPVPTTAFGRCAERHRDHPVPRGEGGLPGAVPRPPPADAARRRPGALRGVHVLPDGVPGHCITIIPEQSDDNGIEKRPAVFEIDELRCVVCGLCVEACPCDAIRMDSGTHAKPVEERADAVMTKDKLLAVSKDNGKSPTSIATQGGAGANWRDGR
jgi:NADH-quinone oxidoreductase subunit I